MYLFENIDLDIVRMGDLPSRLDLFATVPLALVLFWLTLRDIRAHRLPDAGTLPLVVAGLLLGAWRSGGFPAQYAAGAAIGYGLFALLGAVYFRVRRIEGLGLGDAKLMGALGAWLGWTALAPAILLASVAALGAALLSGNDAKRGIAFGPYISAAFMALWLLFLLS